MKCSVVGCANKTQLPLGKSFFRFPKNEDRRMEWLMAIGRLGLKVTASSVVCQDHFLCSDMKNYGRRNHLKQDAVPSVNCINQPLLNNNARVKPSTYTDGGIKIEPDEASTSQDWSGAGFLDETCMNDSSGKATPEDEKPLLNTFTQCSSSALTHVLKVEPNTHANGGIKIEPVEDISSVPEEASTSQGWSGGGLLNEPCMNDSSGKATPDEKPSGNIFTHFSSSTMTDVAKRSRFITAPSPSHSSACSDGIEERTEEKLASQPPTRSKCIFCCGVVRRSGARRVHVRSSNSQSTIENVRKIAQFFTDAELLDRLGNQDTIFYHPPCYSLLLTKYTRQTSEKRDFKGVWHDLRYVHETAFEALSAFIHAEIIENERIFLLTDLLSRYHALLLEMSNEKFCKNDFENYTAQHLQDKILRVFGDVLTVESSPTYGRKRVVYSHEIDISKLEDSTMIEQNTEEIKLQNVAYSVRNSVKATSKRILPEELRLSDDIDECDIPDDLFNLISNLIQGPDTRTQKSEDDLIRIKCICHDIIYAVTKD